MPQLCAKHAVAAVVERVAALEALQGTYGNTCTEILALIGNQGNATDKILNRIESLEAYNEDSRIAADSSPTFGDEIALLKAWLVDLECSRTSAATLCRNFAAGGRCQFGDSCRYAHVHPELPTDRAADTPNVDSGTSVEPVTCIYCNTTDFLGCLADCPMQLQVGDRVEIFGLRCSSDLNGAIGFINKFLYGGRVAVALLGLGCTKSLQLKNLRGNLEEAATKGFDIQTLPNDARLRRQSSSTVEDPTVTYQHITG
jgi:hypothetical protein